MTGFTKQYKAVLAIGASATVNLLEGDAQTDVGGMRSNNTWYFTVIGGGTIDVTPAYLVSGVIIVGSETYTITSTAPLAITDVDGWGITETAAVASTVIVSAGLGTA